MGNGTSLRTWGLRDTSFAFKILQQLVISVMRPYNHTNKKCTAYVITYIHAPLSILHVRIFDSLVVRLHARAILHQSTCTYFRLIDSLVVRLHARARVCACVCVCVYVFV